MAKAARTGNSTVVMTASIVPRRLARIAAVAVIALLAYVLIEVALRFLEPQYSLLRNAESDYGNGRFAWLMDVDFVIRGLLSLATVAAIAASARSTGALRLGLGLLLVWAAASVLLAFFPDDLPGTVVTGAGRIHLALALIAFVAMSIGAAVVAYTLGRQPAWRPVAPLLLGLAVAGLAALPLVGRPPLPRDLGLFERAFLAIELGWLLVAAGWAWRLAARDRA